MGAKVTGRRAATSGFPLPPRAAQGAMLQGARITTRPSRYHVLAHSHDCCTSLSPTAGILIAVWYASSIAQEVLDEADRDEETPATEDSNLLP